ncbi:MAG: NAD-glutamate dehydrogenase [Deltaproteobacteria bacterium]|nr:NAD-glutamate dehydrogenase [Deltaproteobacteria bacterium]
MQTHLDRAELIGRLLTDLGEDHRGNGNGNGNGRGVAPAAADGQLAEFARAVLRRVDDTYLFRHRMTTLGAQLRDSFAWAAEKIGSDDVEVRAFRPRLDTHGYAIEGNVIETLMPDQPFIFDTLKLYMEHASVRVLNSLHIILPAKIAADGTLEEFATAGPGVRTSSYTRWYVDWPANLSHAEVATEIQQRLRLARAMVQDFQRMIRDVRGSANEFDYLASSHKDEKAADCAEVRDFLQWLIDENFVFMGISAYERGGDGAYRAVPERGLGAARGASEPSGPATAATLAFLASSDSLTWPLARVRKSSSDSVLHRRGKVDEIVVRTFDHDGAPAGGLVLHGMFTFKGLGEPGGGIPILRRKLGRIIDHAGAVRTSYEHKSIVHAFNALPVEYLFEADVAAIESLIEMTVSADDSREIRSHIAAQPDSRSAYAFIVLPKEHYSDDLRALLQMVLQAELGASYADHRVYLGKFGSVALHFYLTGSHAFDTHDLHAIEEKLVAVGTPWTLRLRRALEQEYGDSVAAELYEKYSEAFGEGYGDVTDVSAAVVDIRHIERVIEDGRIRFDILPSTTDPSDALLRIYSPKDLLLTDILPVVDNFGIVVAEQFAFDITPEHTNQRLTTNTLRIRRGDPDVLGHRQEVIDALTAVFEKKMRSDRLNRVLLPGRLTWREVDVLRAYFLYSRQVGSGLTSEIVQKTLIAHRGYVHDLAELFRTRFDPDSELSAAQREAKCAAIEKRLYGHLDEVAGFEEDRILRTFLNYVQSTVRTNFYRSHDDGEHFISLKLRCAAVTDMPSPRPLFEIFVHHADVEGVHLRGGKVARGGLRWSDRLDDYRSEVLGLMATQMLKNTLIVPVGAKGGFVLKTPSEDWAEARAKADELYKIFIRGLLDVTDNIVDGEVAPPPRVVRYDEDDPYLVVAADKGTAHLSDTANAISQSYGFWLGDAFASGGSIGYDHKEKGITARGAWVCVRRHFREIGVDPEKDPITCVGIGDMSGDVFGNGLLSSKTIALIGAFDHRHVFIDPNPDAAASFAERERLFKLKRSSWAMYDPALISRGGGVYDRGAKSIKLSQEVRDRLRTELTEVSGEALIRMILTADVDLLWNGGIGTYVKASTETHADVGDSDNDRVRVDGNQLRCRVIGEGGNLGMTMRGRVEFASQGGRVNLDAIDNSGGVDLSDHEVNLKVLLNPLVARGELSRPERDTQLIAVGDDACDKVLANNEGQSLAISLDERRTRDDAWTAVHAMAFLRDEIGFSRYAERLPRSVEIIKQRIATGQGFFRPELAKLLAYTKMYVYRGLLGRPIGDREELLPFLLDYFPRPIAERHREAIAGHLLFNEIAATEQVNRIIDASGITIFPALAIATERPPSDIAAGYLLIEDVFGVAALRNALRAEERIDTDRLYRALIRIEDHIARGTRLFLWLNPEPASLSDRPRLEATREVFAALEKQLYRVVPDRVERAIKDEAATFQAPGLDRDVAARLARMAWVDHAVPIAKIAHETGMKALDVARVYFGLGFETRVLDLVLAIGRQSYPDRWDDVAVHSLARALLASVSRLARMQLAGDAKETAEAWLAARGLADIAAQVQDLLRERIPVSAMLVVSERLKNRIERLELAMKG